MVKHIPHKDTDAGSNPAKSTKKVINLLLKLMGV